MEFADPQKNVVQFGIAEGETIADLGAGIGAYARALGERVGPHGKVFAVEVQKDLVDKLHSELTHYGVENVEVRHGDIETVGGTRLRDDSVDTVLLSNVLFQVEDGEGLVREIVRILKPQGRLIVIDWADSFNNLGPHPDAIIPEDQARQFFENKGFVFEGNIKAGAHHYGFTMQKK